VVNDISHPYSCTIAGYVAPNSRLANGGFSLTLSDEKKLRVEVSDNVSAEIMRNLNEPYFDATANITEMITPGRYLFAYGIMYPGSVFHVKRIIFVGRGAKEYRFEEATWWVKQLESIAGFYRRAQFGDGPVDFSDYRTLLRLGGEKTANHAQETDTISRLVYGMSSAYMLTGNDDYLDVAEKGVSYLQEHMRFVDYDENITYWYHGILIDGQSERKLFASEFSDDYDAIPMYEQIYALAGLTQTYRVTAKQEIRADIEATLSLMEKFFLDRAKGGYFSHIDPIFLNPRQASLDHNRARKNWNSIGDHAPAYLINLFLASGDMQYARMLEATYDMVLEHFLDYKRSPFVQERFHEDWSPDTTYAWQREGAVVGHNLKIAWNLSRIFSITQRPEYMDAAIHIGEIMPSVGSDTLRGGWYDVVERNARDGESFHRFAFHDRKAWWQQEQAILAYLILYALTGRQDFLRQAREAQAFYNAFFLDHDEGGVYFSVLADGTPYLLGNERLKGNHSMSMYHSAELCYLAAVYGNLLIRGTHMDFWFKPEVNGLPDRLLRVSPDILPREAVRITEVEIDGSPYFDYDERRLTVRIPATNHRPVVRVRFAPAREARAAA